MKPKKWELMHLPFGGTKLYVIVKEKVTIFSFGMKCTCVV